jgi:Pyruvate/2-oxoacid:ferredoxin oxidoreductase delta subunit
MEMALGGRPDDSAKMVCSRGCIVYLFPSPLKRQRNFHLPAHSGDQGKGNDVCGYLCSTAAVFMLQKSGKLINYFAS